jgi:hypothetical protein
MDAYSNVALPLPSLALSLRHLSDTEILAGTRRLVGRSNQLMAELLGHLAEVEARGIHRTRACSSLYAYCIYELRFSEDEECRRVAAARLIRRFPALLDAFASGELHLTGLLMLGPHLTEANLTEVLARAKHRTKREFNRDGQQCTHVEPGGRRCAETHRLEFHHLEPFAKGGEHTAANLALRCAAHNALAAEDDFGRELIERAKASRP